MPGRAGLQGPPEWPHPEPGHLLGWLHPDHHCQSAAWLWPWPGPLSRQLPDPDWCTPPCEFAAISGTATRWHSNCDGTLTLKLRAAA